MQTPEKQPQPYTSIVWAVITVTSLAVLATSLALFSARASAS